MMVRYKIVVEGRVQGVFYRLFTQKEAEKLGISGFVTNQKNGSVLIEAQGKKADIERFTTWCKSGPPLAHVTAVKRRVLEIIENEVGFEIRR